MAHDDKSRPGGGDPTTRANLREFLPSISLVQLISLFDRRKARLKSRSFHTDIFVSDDFGPGSGGVGTTECVLHDAVDVAGQSRTDDEGKMTWQLTDFICAGSGPTVEGPASFVATPITTGPIYLTTRIVIPDPPDDLIVDVFTWDSSGSAAPRINFSWRCRVRYREAIG